jgi:hypothetical protein
MTPLGTTFLGYNFAPSQPISAAVESAVDAYATKLLRMQSPPEACIDENLGPYVTSQLRCSMNYADTDVRHLPDFDSLMELLEEHCCLDSDTALGALSTIAKAVRTGVMEVPVDIKGGKDAPGLSVNPFSEEFVPVDLMGVLEDPSTPAAKGEEEAGDLDDAFPPLGASSGTTSTKKAGKPPRNPSKDDTKELAASLFRPSRSRQQSFTDDEGYNSSPNQTSSSLSGGEVGFQAYPLNEAYEQPYYHQQQLTYTVEMLLSMNSELGEVAATEASMLAGSDVNIAQHVIDQALSAPPICRHLLSDGCYRSDCQFRHDVESQTCLFWLRGRCGKGDSCRFRHGFSEKLLEGINYEVLSESKEDSLMYQTAAAGSSLPVSISRAFSNTEGSDGSWSSSVLGSSLGHSTGLDGLTFGMSSMGLVDQSHQSGCSFASVASKGYKRDSFGTGRETEISQSQELSRQLMTVKIPQDLWNPSINRNAGAFHIQNPIERYNEVSKSVSREDVIDLHFQSTKTFPLVLSIVLPLKLRQHDEVWVVTGSGHHVARNSHQKGGGALEAAVLTWLENEGYAFVRGRDRNGHGGALLVKRN